jgi:3-hydroxyisobutyrate dehydrogenase-like beta-hydroxyacid dehydrogenase/ketosteroid isomerase-like protein
MASTTRTRVSVIGLGNLGTALARALLGGGCDVIVWNRTPGRTGTLVDEGATAAPTLRDALEHAEVVVFALPSYEVVDELLGDPIAKGWLKGRAVVNITTGDAAQARAIRDRLVAGGAEYLDGDCGSYPSAIGTDDSLIIYSGPRDLFDRLTESIIEPLGRDGAWVGEDIGAANSLYMATTAFFLNSVVAYFEGAAHADHHDISVQAYADYSVKYLDTVVDLIKSSTPLMRSHDHTGIGQAALAGYLQAAHTVEADAVRAGAPTDLLSVTTRSFEVGMAEGHADSEVSVLFELLRSRSVAADRKERFRDQMRALGRGDIDGVLALFSDDAHYIDMNDERNPLIGKPALREWLIAFTATFGDLEVAVTSVVSEEDRLAAEIEIGAFYTGDEFGPDAKGRPVVLRLSLVQTFGADGLITQERAYSDPGALANQVSSALAGRSAS